jgi:hypothetical protein
MTTFGLNMKLSMFGSPPGRMVSVNSLLQLPVILAEEVESALIKISTTVLTEIERLYLTVSQPGTRYDGTPTLASRLKLALTREVATAGAGIISEVEMATFSVETIRRLTGNREEGEPVYGWFSLREDGSSSRRHGSNIYGFLSVEHATSLAEHMGSMGLSSEKVAELKQHIVENMSGRHGEGIMVKLDEPTFFSYPEFGTAAENGVKPHPGFISWNLYRHYIHGNPAGEVIRTNMAEAWSRTYQRCTGAAT